MDWREKELLESVKRLAAPPDEQAAYLRRIGTSPSLDELALEFDATFGPPGSAAPTGEWSESLRKLDEALSAISGPENARLWTADALGGPEWAEVRALAREAVARRPH